MNNVILIGRLTKDPETYVSSDTKIVKFTLAVNRAGDEADFIRITCFNKLADICEEYLKKGKQVCVNGAISTSSYENSDGDTVYTTDVIANRVEFLGSKDEDKKETPKKETGKKGYKVKK